MDGEGAGSSGEERRLETLLAQMPRRRSPARVRANVLAALRAETEGAVATPAVRVEDVPAARTAAPWLRKRLVWALQLAAVLFVAVVGVKIYLEVGPQVRRDVTDLDDDRSSVRRRLDRAHAKDEQPVATTYGTARRYDRGEDVAAKATGTLGTAEKEGGAAHAVAESVESDGNRLEVGGRQIGEEGKARAAELERRSDVPRDAAFGFVQPTEPAVRSEPLVALEIPKAAPESEVAAARPATAAPAQKAGKAGAETTPTPRDLLAGVPLAPRLSGAAPERAEQHLGDPAPRDESSTVRSKAGTLAVTNGDRPDEPAPRAPAIGRIPDEPRRGLPPDNIAQSLDPNGGRQIRRLDSLAQRPESAAQPEPAVVTMEEVLAKPVGTPRAPAESHDGMVTGQVGQVDINGELVEGQMVAGKQHGEAVQLAVREEAKTVEHLALIPDRPGAAIKTWWGAATADESQTLNLSWLEVVSPPAVQESFLLSNTISEVTPTAVQIDDVQAVDTPTTWADFRTNAVTSFNSIVNDFGGYVNGAVDVVVMPGQRPAVVVGCTVPDHNGDALIATVNQKRLVAVAAPETAQKDKAADRESLRRGAMQAGVERARGETDASGEANVDLRRLNEADLAKQPVAAVSNFFVQTLPSEQLRGFADAGFRAGYLGASRYVGDFGVPSGIGAGVTTPSQLRWAFGVTGGTAGVTSGAAGGLVSDSKATDSARGRATAEFREALREHGRDRADPATQRFLNFVLEPDERLPLANEPPAAASQAAPQ